MLFRNLLPTWLRIAIQRRNRKDITSDIPVGKKSPGAVFT
jgi:hypothetical protein